MPRPQRCRRICREPDYVEFSPEGFPSGREIILTVDEYEVIRLVDLEKQTHQQCAEQMDISRTTVTEIYETAREKLADAVVNGKSLVIKGGNVSYCHGASKGCCRHNCEEKQSLAVSENIVPKGEKMMRVAVTYDNEEIFQHFGHTEQFKIYDIENGEITNEFTLDTNGTGHGALANLLRKYGVEVLICGGIGGGAQMALREVGIKLFGGVSGKADEAVKALAKGELNYNPNVKCNHHGEGHNCGEQSCGEHHHHHCGGHCHE